jgi:branched-chain amino acid transport system ATP-binding protein
VATAEPRDDGQGWLRARDLRVFFEAVKAVDGVDLDLRQGEILGLIGPNGAGKTTLVNALSGFQRLDGGSVLLDRTDVTGWGANRLARVGLVRTFQNVRLFSGLSVFENVEAGAVGVGLRRKDARERTQELLERFHLEGHADRPASDLPHGAERRVGIVRALASQPKFLLLDEPAAGLNEAESDELVRTLVLARDDFRCGLMVIEHDMRVIMQLCERVHVLDYGHTISIGAPAEVRRDPAVLRAYLGTRRGASTGSEERGRDAGD